MEVTEEEEEEEEEEVVLGVTLDAGTFIDRWALVAIIYVLFSKTLPDMKYNDLLIQWNT